MYNHTAKCKYYERVEMQMHKQARDEDVVTHDLSAALL